MRNLNDELRTPDLCLEFCSGNDPRYLEIRERHYVPSKGTHGQQIHFIIWYKGEIAGIISGASAVYATAARDTFFGINSANRTKVINGIVDNVVFRLENHERNLGSRVLSLWEKTAQMLWEELYGVKVYGFETFIVRQGMMREAKLEGKHKEKHEVFLTHDPDQDKERVGGTYKAANWKHCGETSGSAKGHDGVGLTGGLSGGKGGFSRKKTPTKDVYCKWVKGYTAPVEAVYNSSWMAATSEGTPEEKRLARERTSLRKSLLGRRFYKAGTDAHALHSISNAVKGARTTKAMEKAQERAENHRELRKLEEAMRTGLSKWVKVGKALKVIQSKKLYRLRHKSFGVYCDREWGFTRSAAYGYLYAVEVVESVLSNVQIPQTKAVALYPLKDVSKRQEIVDLRGFAKMTVREVMAEVTKRQPAPVQELKPNRPATVARKELRDAVSKIRSLASGAAYEEVITELEKALNELRQLKPMKGKRAA